MSTITTTPAHITLSVAGKIAGGASQGPGGWGFVATLHDTEGAPIARHHACGPSRFVTTLPRAGMVAAAQGLAFVAGERQAGRWPLHPVTVTTHAELLTKGMTEWVPKWAANGWKGNKGKPVENRDLWEALLAAADGLAVRWQWVRTGTGDADMAQALVLAAKAAEEAARKGVILRPDTA